MTKEKVLLIGPHPDDVFISCGGFVIKNIDIYDVDVCCIATQGLSPSNEIRIEEEKNAWSQVSDNVRLSLFDFGVDTMINESYNDLVNFLEKKVKIEKYKYIFTPFVSDTHQDHRAVSQAALSACRYSKNVIFYETPSTYDFIPSMFVELSDKVLERKKEISKAYSSQILGSDEFAMNLQCIIESKAISNGSKTRVCRYAEGFSPFKLFM